MLRVLVPALLLSTIVPAHADDDFLKRLFNGNAYAATSQASGTPIAEESDRDDDTIEYEDTTPNERDPDVDRFRDADEGGMTADNQEYVDWYLEGIQGAYRPEGMTDGEFAVWVDDGCPGEEDASKCGMTATAKEAALSAR